MALAFPGSTIRWQLGRLIEALPGWSPTGGLPVTIWPSVETVLTYRSGGEQVTIPAARLSATVLADGQIVQDGKPLILPRDVEGMSTRGLTWWAQVAGLKEVQFACPTVVTDIATFVGQAPVPGGGGSGGGGLTAEQAQDMIDTTVAAHNGAADAHGMTVLGKSLLQAETAPAARKALDVGRIASGTGFPEGARSGVVGDLYIDTNQTLGAVVWVKTTASGATGWKVLFGDTGWRDITAMIAPGFVPATQSPKARICRAAGLVQLDLRLQVAADASFIGASRTVAQSILVSMQSSWNPGVYTSLVSWSVAAGVWSINTFSSPAILKCQSTVGNWAAGDTISALMTWPAVTPWVTAMLGSAV